MRIFFSPDGSDPMLLATKAGLHAVHQQLRTFLRSAATTVTVPAAIDGSPKPYEEFLFGLRVVKGTGEATLSLASDRWLVLQGSSAELQKCADKFLIEEEDGHVHLHTAPVSLIIESESA